MYIYIYIYVYKYICCTMETGKHLVKKQVFPASFPCVAFSREYFD